MLHQGLIDQCLAIFADAVRTVIIALNTYPARLITLWANKHNIRDIERCFELDAAWVNSPSLGLYLSLVLGMDVHTLHNHPMFFRKYLDDLATLTFFF
jgi:hypothetical protein